VTLKRRLREMWMAGRWSAALATLLGVVGMLVPSTPLERWSYDLPQLYPPQVSITNVAIIYMDEVSHANLDQAYYGPWDRSLHAQLVDVLTKYGAKAIAFDVFFNDPGTNGAASEALVAAISAHGRVVLAADLGSSDYYGLASDTKLIRPHPMFLAAKAHWGFSQLPVDGDDHVRAHFHGWKNVPSLSWEVATVLGAPATTGLNAQRRKRWLNYYGYHGTIPSLSLDKALDRADPAVSGLITNRVVFVGSSTQAGFSGKRRDQFHPPYWGESEKLWPGVDFHATQFLNLMRGDWLRRLDPLAETGLVVLSGLLAGFGLTFLRPRAATLTALAASALVMITACLLVWHAHMWFSWTVVAGVQIPVALACLIVRRAEQAALVRPADLTTDFGSTDDALTIADHEMLRPIGSGSYGEVWLARSATGTLRAVKVVDRKSARDPRFEREFAGLLKFEPISRAHEGLVDILHVGRNEKAGQLYYVMELADNSSTASSDDADRYVPTTLISKLQSRGGQLDGEEICLLTLALTSALAFLHEQGLIHRDIKPSNIIFVQGQPKLADIGLVAAADETRSFVGTEGYIPPEGPGTPAADVFSLGKVLSSLLDQSSSDIATNKKLAPVRHVIEKACALNLSKRFQNGSEMQAAVRKACESGGFD
jgi:CHASE2 domain-containing sensor protein